MHAIARLEQEGLRHEGRIDAVSLGDRADDVLEVDGCIGHLHEGAVTQVDLGLAWAIFDIAGLNLDSGFAQCLADIEHERLHLGAARDGVAVDVVVEG